MTVAPATSAHPTSARACPAFAGNAQLDGQRGGGVLDAARQMPSCQRSTQRWRATRGASFGERRHGEGAVGTRPSARWTDGAGGARDASRARAARPRGTTSGSTHHGDGGQRAGDGGQSASDDEREPAFADATTTASSRPGPYEGPRQM
ncbi:hypothetical protein K523DRAFT_359192 [Schizophyllum commune Tattone D]|nr:hypothetical protein K523DRAFT_359192 [Schizophyllum commune Tattone D]